ncbi:hypothetical protein PV327_010317 [Microctonus hyperodae]|uniref:Uncharacterized protein n=1 Tax=Microctonus hyperodae TaxID=165561 RepID=A0AA39FRW8_MICHY|nr:hypothetical protein PV327_010317 [Microctonus hyperodae]
MEDEDGESINVDSWPVSEENSFKDSLHGCETLNNKANNVADYLDGVEENKEETSSDDKIFHSKLVFKGFKKRILAQTQDNQLPERIINQDLSLTSSPKSSKDRSNDNKRGKITEYAQYLGLQPIGKYKCPKCNPIVTFRTMAMLKQHQSVCMSNTNSNHILPSTSDQQIINNTISSSTNNFRISRKVYLCSACGTYFENWNLFLHMREIHKRHICLFCLGMFGQAERLSHHLVKKHSVPETQFHTVDDFYTVFKGSCYLICCICEKVFSETDDFYTHNCDSINQRLITNSLCSVCRQTDGKHLSTCKFDINYERNNSNDRIQASDSEQTLFPNPANAMAKKLLGANKSRFKTNERAILSSYKSKLLNLYAKNVKSKIINRNCELSINTINNSSSKFDNDRLIHFNNTIKNRHIVEIDVTKSPAHETTIDKYTDTIMKVSQCKNIKNYDEFQMNFDIDEEIDPDDYNQMNNFDDTSDNIEKGELILDDGNDDTPIGSPIASPNHLNFTSNQEPIIKNLDQLNSSCINSDDNIDCNNTPAEELPNLTVSRVNSTNRSLVIKICANKNSQFSVSTPNVNGNYDDNEDEDDEEEEEEEEEEDGESEDNNKSGGSEKELSINDHESDSDGENLITKLPEELNIGNNIEPIIEPTTQVSIVNTTEDEGEIKAPEDPTDLSTATESSTVAAANESTLINEEENKITEISQTKETTFEIEPITSETIKLNNENELLLNIDNSKSNDSIIIDKTNELSNDKKDENFKNDKELISSDEITLANDETPSIDINVDGTLDSIEIDDLLKRCIEAASPTCIYCNHARHIAVNGKQLALHMLAEHRFQPQHPAIIIQHDQFNTRVKKSLNELTSSWFNLDSYDNKRGTYNVSTVKIYECYLCHIYYSVHKELCLHNRKMHQKTILICIMCKSTFYSHSELVCHLCPGIYSSHINIRYRCCLCDIESLPSAFRLMVHLRKRHHACDVCLESTGNQQRLSNHVWKHKLHHLCYRCGIAYRNKPDITKHLFWKHGTESVLCKKCLQKKWPHIYHFCIPPSAFVCDECGATFSRAVALKVHKRLHTGDEPHECLECSARFISKKLLDKHSDTHKPLKIQSLPLQFNNDNEENHQINVDVDVHTGVICNNEIQNESNDEIKNVTVNLPKDNVKKVLDVYDLPPLNLSSDSDTDVEDDKLSLRKDSNVDNSQNVEGINDNDNIDVEMVNLIDNSSNKSTIVENFEVKLDNIADNILSTETNDNICDVDESNEEEIKKEEVVIMNGIWDNFKSYTASLEVKEQSNIIDNELPKNHELLNIIAIEHDYCTVYDDNSKEENEIISNSDVNNDEQIKAELNSSINEINVSANGDNTNDITKRKTNKSPKKKTKQSQDNVDGSSSSSDSSSDSDSSSCSCGTNCSCSSSSSGSSTSSSSSSDSDSSTSESSPKKSSVVKKDRRKDKDTKKNRNKDLLSESTHVDVEIQIETKNNIETIDNRVEEEIKENTNANEQTINNIILPPAPSPLRESDLETDETETDEDFYDEYPQQHANNLLAEKRNQLMLLATVAPQSADDSALGSSSNDMKNGNIIDNSIPMTNSPSEQLSMTQTSTNTKRKIKTKRRKKGEGGRGRGKRQQNSLQSTPTIVNQLPIIESIKLNIPKILYRNKKPGVRRNSSSPNVNTVKTREPKLPAVTYQISQTDYNINQLGQLKTPNAHNVSNDNESANENKRSSKRKRVPKKFYGDSSDEDQRLSNSFNQKWRRIDTQIPTNSYVPSITIKQNYGPPSSTFQSTTNYQPASVIPEPQTETLSVPISTPAREPTPVSSVADSDNPPDDSSSDSSTSEIEQPRHHPPRQHPGDDNSQGTMLPNRQANLYCYCQCPYDEVSEMIACDGDSCRIEWFHFECVGIMVPPKGKWYCPDCSKRDPTLPSNEYFV